MVQFVIDTDYPVSVPCGDVTLEGLLHIPRDVKGIVIFAHGSGSSRLSPRNQYIARMLQQAHLATLLFDLLTVDEDTIDTQTAQFRFDIPFLADRLLSVTLWIVDNPVFHKLPLGYFGASTGGGAALLAASKTQQVKAVVSRGGRPDLAGEEALGQVRAATLFIVGGHDKPVIDLNRKAFGWLQCVKKVEIIPHASHLFEEPGALAQVGELAKKWFEKYL